MFTGCGSSEEQTLEPLPSDTSATPAVSLDFSSMEADPFPLTIEEFEKRKASVPDEENAALVVLAVAEAMDQILTLDQAAYPVEFKKGDMANTLIPYLAPVANKS